jgi:hypothetical protein
MYYPPPASSVLNAAWNAEQYSGFAPSGAVYPSWKNHRNTPRSAYLANTLNHYEDLGSRNRFVAGAIGNNQEPSPNAFSSGGEIPWIVAKFTGTASSLLASSTYYQHTRTPYKFYHRTTKTTEFSYVNSGSNKATVFPVGPLLNSTNGIFPSIPLPKYVRTVWSIEYNATTNRYERKQTAPYYVASALASIFRLQFEAIAGDSGSYSSRQVYKAFDDASEKIENQQKSSYLGVPSLKLNALSSNYLSSVNTTLFIIFKEYCHYVSAIGGQGLIDLTPFTVNATTFFKRQIKTDIYSAYGTDGFNALIDYNNQVTPVKLWPTTYLTGIPAE